MTGGHDPWIIDAIVLTDSQLSFREREREKRRKDEKKEEERKWKAVNNGK